MRGSSNTARRTTLTLFAATAGLPLAACGSAVPTDTVTATSPARVVTVTETPTLHLVDGDVFQAKVTVVGSYSYATQAGGKTTVPALFVDWVEVVGSES